MLTFGIKLDLGNVSKFHRDKIMKLYNESNPIEDGDKGAASDTAEIDEMKCTDPTVIGYEVDNLILFTWSCQAHPFGKTFVALYDINFEISKLIYVSDQEIKIINATVNSELSLIAFTIVEEQNINDISTNIFKSYIAGIAPQNQILCLAASDTLQKMKFLSPQSAPGKMSHLILMHHAVSINIYHIPLANINNKFLMNEKPTSQKIVRKFLWCQFDICAQRLYFVELLPQDVDDIHAIALFTVVEFKADGDFEYILNFPLPINFKMNCFDTLNSNYSLSLSNIVSSSQFNMVVLTSKSGAFYLCSQHSVKRRADGDVATPDTLSTDSSKEPSLPDSSNENCENDCYLISYTVCCIHGAYKLNCSSLIKKSILCSGVEKPLLLFTLFNDYLVIYLPNIFLHLLDTGTEHEPGFNILLRNTELIPAVPSSVILVNYQYFISKSNALNLIYNGTAQVVYDIKLSLKNVFRYFLCSDTPTRLSILHSCVVHFNEKRLIRKFLDQIIQSPANIGTKELMKEFLLASSYNQMKKVVAFPTDVKIFPFTAQELFRGQIERDSFGNRVVYLNYKEFDDNLKKQLLKVLVKNKSIFWKQIYTILSFEIENKGKRFSVKALSSLKPQNREKVHLKRVSNQFTLRSNFNEMRSRAFSMFASTSQLPTANTSLDIAVDVSEIKNTNEIVTECMINFLTKAYGNELKGKANNLCREYVLQQNKTILLLWKIVLKTFNFSRNPSLLFSKDLMSKPAIAEVLLFQALERLIISTNELCYPGFPGMNYLYTLLAVKCLSREQFLQYVDSTIIELQPDLALSILREIIDVEEGWKFKLLSYLSRENVYYVLQQWENPMAQRYLAQYKLLKVSSHPVFQSCDISDQFVPLETLVESIDKTVLNGNIEEQNKNEYMKDLMKKTALMSIEKLQ